MGGMEFDLVFALAQQQRQLTPDQLVINIRWVCVSLHTLSEAPLSIPWVIESFFYPPQRLAHDARLAYVTRYG